MTSQAASTTDVTAFSPMDMKPMRSDYLKSTIPFRVASWLTRTFAKVGQRDPPASGKTHHIRLIAISVSPYVEKVRWGLDILEADSRSPVYYTEDCHPPGGCAVYTTEASNDRASQSPMIVDDNGQVVWGSDAILQYLFVDNKNCSINLYPTEIKDDIKALEQDLGLRLGASARCLAYQALLDPSQPYYQAATRVLVSESPWIERMVYKLLVYTGMVWKILSETLKTNDPQVIANSERQVREVFAEISEKLEQAASGDDEDIYLMDTPTKRYGFTAADITCAALVYHLLRPQELAPLNIPAKEMPPRIMKMSQALSNTTAGKHILKVYRKHRPTDVTKAHIVLKSVNQNRIPWKGLTSTLVAAIGVLCWLLVVQ